MTHFTVENLHRGELREAWPVVRTSGWEAKVEWWVTHATELIERGGGVLAARAPDGSIHGIVTYDLVGTTPPARRLAVEILVTFELNRSAPARRALCEALEQVATSLNCTGIGLPLFIKAA